MLNWTETEYHRQAMQFCRLRLMHYEPWHHSYKLDIASKKQHHRYYISLDKHRKQQNLCRRESYGC